MCLKAKNFDDIETKELQDLVNLSSIGALRCVRIDVDFLLNTALET